MAHLPHVSQDGWQEYDPNETPPPPRKRVPKPAEPRPRPHICGFDGCGRAFDRPSSLQQHELIHTGEKPHRCSKCYQRSFSTISNKLRHERTCRIPPIPYDFPSPSSQYNNEPTSLPEYPVDVAESLNDPSGSSDITGIETRPTAYPQFERYEISTSVHHETGQGLQWSDTQPITGTIGGSNTFSPTTVLPVPTHSHASSFSPLPIPLETPLAIRDADTSLQTTYHSAWPPPGAHLSHNQRDPGANIVSDIYSSSEQYSAAQGSSPPPITPYIHGGASYHPNFATAQNSSIFQPLGTPVRPIGVTRAQGDEHGGEDEGTEDENLRGQLP